MKIQFVKKVILLAILLILPIQITNAKTLQNMYNELSELQKQQAKVNSGKTLTTSQINSLKAEINSINASITLTEKEITKSEKEIKESEEKIKKKKEETNQMLLYLQLTNGKGTNMLEYVFDAEDYTDFIYRYSVVTQMSDANTQLVDELNALITDLNNKKAELAKKQTELSNRKQSVTTKVATLNANLSELNEEGTSIADDIKALKSDIARYEKMGCSKNTDVDTCARKTLEASLANVNVSNASAGGWTLPVPSAIVTSQFQVVRTDCIGCGGSSHRGIDLGVSYGSTVYAAAPGQVASVITSGSSLSCGGKKVYIYHNVGGKLYTSVYMHLSATLVNVGQVVTPSTAIAKSGGTESYDRCSTGAHLHFGVASGNTVSGFNSNAFNPRQLSFLSGAANGVRVSR